MLQAGLQILGGVMLELRYNNFSDNLPPDLERLSSAKEIIINDNMRQGENEGFSFKKYWGLAPFYER